MSRAYRIKVRESVKRDIAGSDEVCSELELLDILPAEAMRGLLADELKRRGFQEKEGKLSRENGGIRVTVDPATGEVKVTSEEKTEATIEGEHEGMGFDDLGPSQRDIEAKLRKELGKDIEERAKRLEADLQKKATEQLEKGLAEVSGELDQVVNAVTREALKRKAATLGQIKEISEDAASGSLTIKVEV